MSKTIYSKQNIAILKEGMITEQTTGRMLGSKTGWTFVEGTDVGWWAGYLNRRGMIIFSLPRISNSAQFQTLALVNIQTINIYF